MKTVTLSNLIDEAGPAKSPQLRAPDVFASAPPPASAPDAFALVNALLADLQPSDGQTQRTGSRFADLARQCICHAAEMAVKDAEAIGA